MQRCSELKCKNCGECCGSVPINRDERNKIRIYLLKHPEIAEEVQKKLFSMTCIFYDNGNKKCMIYRCRPEICRLYRCDTLDWRKNLKVKGSDMQEAVLINERFGNPKFKEDYANLRKLLMNPEFITKVREKKELGAYCIFSS